MNPDKELQVRASRSVHHNQGYLIWLQLLHVEADHLYRYQRSQKYKLMRCTSLKELRYAVASLPEAACDASATGM
jgi:hypothetical protein